VEAPVAKSEMVDWLGRVKEGVPKSKSASLPGRKDFQSEHGSATFGDNGSKLESRK